MFTYYRRILGRCTTYRVSQDGTVERWWYPVPRHAKWVQTKRTVECLNKWVERGSAVIVPESQIFLEHL
jgi:hypothetical protein